MNKYAVEWTHIQVTSSASGSELNKYLLDEMCLKAAKGVQLQCSREYGGDAPKIRATQVHKLSPGELEKLPTNNLVCERYLATFGYLSSLSAKRSNKFFKAKRIRDDLMFWGSAESSVFQRKDLAKVRRLDARESDWVVKEKDVKVTKLTSDKKRS